jgi:hypothetical protein
LFLSKNPSPKGDTFQGVIFSYYKKPPDTTPGIPPIRCRDEYRIYLFLKEKYHLNVRSEVRPERHGPDIKKLAGT